MTDISALGTTCVVKSNGASSVLSRHDFSAEVNPLEISPLQSAKMEIDLSGEPVTYAVRQPYEVQIALIPGSPSDVSFRNLLYASRTADKESSYKIDTFTISYPSEKYVQFSNGRVIDGTVAAGVGTDGRLKGGRYKMSFAQVEYSNGNTNLNGTNFYSK